VCKTTTSNQTTNIFLALSGDLDFFGSVHWIKNVNTGEERECLQVNLVAFSYFVGHWAKITSEHGNNVLKFVNEPDFSNKGSLH